MEFGQVIKAVGIAIQAQVPTLLEGGVGEAKTSIVDSLFKRLCDAHHTSIVALHEPPEYGGYPVPMPATDDEPAGVALLPVAWANRLGRAKRPGLFLDEFSDGAPATRSAAQRGVLDGTWGDAHIPNLATVAAMNPPDIAESGYELSAPLATRFCHIDWDMPVPYWNEQLVAGFPDPELTRIAKDWRKRCEPAATTYLSAFAHANPGAIKQTPAHAAERAKPFPCFRSFTKARDLMAACASVGLPLNHDITVLLVSGCVGPLPAKEFLEYAEKLDLPDPEELLKNPSALELPARGDQAYAVLTAVVTCVLANNTLQRWDAAWSVLAQAIAQNRPDVAASSAKALAAQRPAKGKLPKEVSAFVPLLKAAGLMR